MLFAKNIYEAIVEDDKELDMLVKQFAEKPFVILGGGANAVWRCQYGRLKISMK